MVALAADKILMSPAGFLTAIDSSITHGLNPKGSDGRPVQISVDQIKRIINFLNSEGQAKDKEGTKGPYQTLFEYIHPLVIGEIDRASSLSELIAKKIMFLHPQTFRSEEHIHSIASRLINNYPAHGFPILYQEAIDIGLPVEKTNQELSVLLYNLVKLLDSTSLQRTTNFSAGLRHVESLPVTVESLGKRTTYRYTFDQRFNSITKNWQLENDNSSWVNIKPSTTPDKPFVVSSIDAIEEFESTEASRPDQAGQPAPTPKPTPGTPDQPHLTSNPTGTYPNQDDSGN